MYACQNKFISLFFMVRIILNCFNISTFQELILLVVGDVCDSATRAHLDHFIAMIYDFTTWRVMNWWNKMKY